MDSKPSLVAKYLLELAEAIQQGEVVPTNWVVRAGSVETVFTLTYKKLNEQSSKR